MSKTPKTAKGRAAYAARVLKSGGAHDRTFDACFEMHDGGKVAWLLVQQSRADADLLAAIKQRGFSAWLAPGYFERIPEPRQLPGMADGSLFG